MRRSSPRSYYRRQSRQDPEVTSDFQESDDVTLQVNTATTAQELLTLTRDGKAYTVAVGDIPTHQRQSKGVPLVSLLPSSVPTEPGMIVDQRVLWAEIQTHDLIMLTRQGRIKRLPLADFTHLTGRGLTALKLKGEDEVAYVTLAQAQEQLVIATSGGRLLRFVIDDDNLSQMGRAAQGPQAVRLRKQEWIVGCARVQDETDCVLLVSAAGFTQRLPVKALPLAMRGGLGTQAFLFKQKRDLLVALTAAPNGGDITVTTTANRVAQIPVGSIPRQGRERPATYRFGPLEKEEKIDTVTLATGVARGASED